jgi:CheY-like chemotaxis protein
LAIRLLVSAGVARGQDDRPLQGLRIGVVEDDPLSLEVLCQALEFYGARVAGVPSVAEARALLVQSTPDVIVTDIHLGSDTGIRLLEWVRAQPDAALAEVPALAITAYPRSTANESSHAFADWLIKPLTMDVVCAAVLRATTARSERRVAGL